MKIDIKNRTFNGGAAIALVKKYWMLLAALVLGIVLLSSPGEKSGEEPESGAVQSVPEFSLEKEEKRIAQALREISGAGSVSVVLTLKSSVEQKIARDETSNYSTLSEGYELSSESSAVKMQDGNDEKPVVLKYVYPEYKGALVVVDSAGASLRLEITNAVAALTGLPTDKISVVPGKK